jgi:sugar lactone lactonase YvrE
MKIALPAFVAVSFASAAVQAGTFVKSVDLAPRARPESITKGWDGKYYVSIQGTASDNTTADGEIVQVDIAAGIVTPFVPPGKGLVNPRGLAFTGEWLVVTDTTNVWKVDAKGDVNLAVPGSAYPHPPVFLNDAAPEAGGRAVFVTDMGAGRNVQRDPSGFLWPADSAQAEAIPTESRVYRISLPDGKVTSVFTPTRKALVMNGVTESKRAKGNLLVLDFFNGSVVEVDAARDTKTILAAGPFRGADGIEEAKDGTLYVNSFENGRVWRMDRNGENVQKLFDVAVDEGKSGRQTLADFALDEEAGLLYVPDTANSRIVVLKVR